MDSDDEVRDRATFYLNVLQQRQLALNAAYIFNGERDGNSPARPSSCTAASWSDVAAVSSAGLIAAWVQSFPVQPQSLRSGYLERCQACC